MTSRTKFAPGNNKLGCQKLIQYAEIINNNPNNPNSKQCIYTNYQIIDKSTTKPNISTNQRAAQIINTAIGGNTHFGNYYLGEPVVFNFLGRVEGQIGGSGAPLRNRF
jgi:hypothetical protein